MHCKKIQLVVFNIYVAVIHRILKQLKNGKNGVIMFTQGESRNKSHANSLKTTNFCSGFKIFSAPKYFCINLSFEISLSQIRYVFGRLNSKTNAAVKLLNTVDLTLLFYPRILCCCLMGLKEHEGYISEGDLSLTFSPSRLLFDTDTAQPPQVLLY